MRLIEGRELTDVIGGRPLDPRRAVTIVTQICSALNAAHKVGLIHRDVKPSNILVADDDFAYLIDFGIARSAGETALTKAGHAIGTFAYMAPERFNGVDSDARSDTYALTCVLHECLTGRQPYPGDSLEELLRGHLMRPPPRPSTEAAGVSPAFDAVVARGMAKDPQQRYATTLELAHAARSVPTVPDVPVVRQTYAPAPLQPTTFRPVTPPPQAPPRIAGTVTSPWWRRRAVAFAAAGVCAGLAVAVAIAVIAGGDGAPSPNAEESTSVETPVTQVPETQLNALLLSPEEIASIVGAETMDITGRSQSEAGQAGMVTPAECLGVVYPVQNQVYGGSGWSGVEYQALTDPGAQDKTRVEQAVVYFESAERAQQFLSQSHDVWRRCESKVVSARDSWTVGPIRDPTDQIITQWLRPRNSGGQSCQHAMGAVANIIVESVACGDGIDTQAEKVVDEIFKRAASL